MKSLWLRRSTPEEECVYLTYSINNEKREESKILLENYGKLLQKALDWLWERIRVRRREVRKDRKVLTKLKIQLPKKRKVYNKLKDELERVYALASHHGDKAISDAFSILKSRKRRAEKGQASPRKPRLKRVYVRVKSTLRRVEAVR
ncbi:hypothetical protein HS7_01980 [Sulfolobales archaeon HS-7]|nr:hypothetical protein HS7_01980 [Sulfolobales archaeon HS-7]